MVLNFSSAWLPSQQHLGIAYKELYPILIACHIWGSAWCRKRILFHCDNESIVHIVRSGSSKDENIMHLVRELFLISARFDFRISAIHIPGKTNLLADALSHFNFQDFFRLAPHAQPTPKVIPPKPQTRLTCNL